MQILVLEKIRSSFFLDYKLRDAGVGPPGATFSSKECPFRMKKYAKENRAKRWRESWASKRHLSPGSIHAWSLWTYHSQKTKTSPLLSISLELGFWCFDLFCFCETDSTNIPLGANLFSGGKMPNIRERFVKQDHPQFYWSNNLVGPSASSIVKQPTRVYLNQEERDISIRFMNEWMFQVKWSQSSPEI